MTDAHLMDAGCVHGTTWYECDTCTCYLGDPDDPTRDEEACTACDAAHWENPVYIDLGGDHP